jgi:hypothetical protein
LYSPEGTTKVRRLQAKTTPVRSVKTWGILTRCRILGTAISLDEVMGMRSRNELRVKS